MMKMAMRLTRWMRIMQPGASRHCPGHFATVKTMKVPASRLLLLLLVALAPLGGCKERAAAHTERSDAAVAVTLVPARSGPVQRHADVVGTLYGDEETTVSAKVPGRIVQVLKDVGDRVAPDETLAQIERTDYDLAVAQKEMAVKAAVAKLGLADLPAAGFDLAKVPTVERARLQSANAEAKFERGKRLHDQQPP